MAAQDDGLAAAGERENQVFHFATTDRIQTGSGFVQNHEVRVIDQRLSQPDAALHAFGKLAHHPAAHLVQPHHLQQLLGATPPFFVRQIEQAAEEVECLVGIEVAVEIRFLRQVTDARLDRDVPRGVAEHFDVSFRRIQQAQQHFDRRGFA